MSPSLPQDLILLHSNSGVNPVTVALIIEETQYTRPDYNNQIPIISQTQDDTNDNIPHNDSDYITDDDGDDNVSITSQVSKSLTSEINDTFEPHSEEYHSLLLHRYNDRILELDLRYSTGEAEFLAFDLVLSDDPLAVAYYIIVSTLSTNK